MNRQPGVAAGSDSGRMRRQATRDTAPEMALRRELHARGLRYYIHRRPLPNLRREADIVFPRAKVAVFVDGCWWHGCPEHAGRAKANDAFWDDKIQTNQARDAETVERLSAEGWLALRFWEHDPPAVTAGEVERAVRDRSG